jgi:parvulin-like peptidyl-prolyl isomerase
MSKKISVIIIFCSIAIFSFFACQSKDNVVIQVGKTKITKEMVRQRLESMPSSYQSYVNTPIGKKQFIDTLLRETIILEEAKKAKIDKSKEYKDNLADFKAQQEKQFKEYEDGLILEIYFRQLQNDLIVSDEDVKAYYNSHIELYEAPISYTVRHVLVTSRDEADKAYNAIQKDEDFVKVVKEYSQDQASIPNGGLVGPFRIGALVPEFEKVALSLKNGEISGIVETDYGYHIIQKISQQKLPQIPFEQAETEIKSILARDKFNSWYDQKKKDLKVKVNYESQLEVQEEQK